MRFLAPMLLIFVACTDTQTATMRQAVGESCGELPPLLSLDGWDGGALFHPTTRAVTLTYLVGRDQFVAYGIDVDAQAVAWAMSGPAAELDRFLAASNMLSAELGIVAPIVVKGGEGGPMPEPGDPPIISAGYLLATATMVADAVHHPDWCN